MRCVIAAAGICFFATVCSAQGKYSNSKWHFSFTVPEGWEVITDETVLGNYAKIHKIRFEGPEILAVCLEPGPKERKSSMLVQVQEIGEAKEGLSMETVYEEALRSNSQWEESAAYLKDFWRDLRDWGDVDREAEFYRQIYYDTNRHIFCEMAALPLKSGGAIGISTLRVLGSNKAVILSFELYGKSVDGLSNLVKGVTDSFAYEEHHGFGEATATDTAKVLWHWLVPGAGTLIISFIVYKWVASEYG